MNKSTNYIFHLVVHRIIFESSQILDTEHATQRAWIVAIYIYIDDAVGLLLKIEKQKKYHNLINIKIENVNHIKGNHIRHYYLIGCSHSYG